MVDRLFAEIGRGLGLQSQERDYCRNSALNERRHQARRLVYRRPEPIPPRKGRLWVGVQFYTGVPSADRDPMWPGFGRFSRKSRSAREGRNPRTGERITIGPSATVSFRASKALKDALN